MLNEKVDIKFLGHQKFIDESKSPIERFNELMNEVNNSFDDNDNLNLLYNENFSNLIYTEDFNDFNESKDDIKTWDSMLEHVLYESLLEAKKEVDVNIKSRSKTIGNPSKETVDKQGYISHTDIKFYLSHPKVMAKVKKAKEEIKSEGGKFLTKVDAKLKYHANETNKKKAILISVGLAVTYIGIPLAMQNMITGVEYFKVDGIIIIMMNRGKNLFRTAYIPYDLNGNIKYKSINVPFIKETNEDVNFDSLSLEDLLLEEELNNDILNEGKEWKMTLSEFKGVLGKVADSIKADKSNSKVNFNIGSISSEEKDGINKIFLPVNKASKKSKNNGAKRVMLKSKGITFIIYEGTNGEISKPFAYLFRDDKNTLKFKFANKYLKKAYKENQ